MKAHFLEPCLARPQQSWTLQNLTTGTALATHLIRAFDRRTRNAGLLGREHLPPETAIVLAPCSGVHTWFMRFAIDVVFVDRGGRVLGVRRSVQPWRLAVRLGAFAAIELPEHGARETVTGHVMGLREGSLL